MPAFSLIFNKLQVMIPANKISLSVDSSVSLQCSDGNKEPMKIRQLLDLLCTGKVWITHGNGCRIDFAFLVDGLQNEKLIMEKIIEDLAAYVRDLPLWSQVSLTAELEEFPQSGIKDSLRTSFSIILKYGSFRAMSDHANSPLASAQARVQVPSGIRCFQLRKIKIVMTFNSGRTYPNPRPPLPHLGGFKHSTSGPLSDSLLCEGLEMLEYDISLYGRDVAIPLLKSQMLTMNQPALPSPPNSQEEEIEKILADSSITSITSDLNYAREMVHLALRKLIFGSQNKSYAGMKVVLHRPTLTLSKLAPSFFCPAFVELDKAMSQRAQFIPTISHILSVSLLRNAQSPCLRRKLLSMASGSVRQPGNGILIDPDCEIEYRSDYMRQPMSWTLGEIVEERIWGMVQCSLSQPSSRIAVTSHHLDKSTHTRLAVDLAEASTGRQEKVRQLMKEPLSFTNHGQNFSKDDFEDLLGDRPDTGKSEGFESLFSDSMNDMGINDDFEDLFEDEASAEPDGVARVECEGHNVGFDTLNDYSVQYREYLQNIDTSDAMKACSAKGQDWPDLEDEEMLI